MQELIGEGNQVVARLRVVGKHTGAHPRMPEPTGRDRDVEQIWIFTLTDGLVTEIRAVSDRLSVTQTLTWYRTSGARVITELGALWLIWSPATSTSVSSGRWLLDESAARCSAA